VRSDTDVIESRLARRLAGLRAEKGWSLDGLAERTGISRATLSRVENGSTSPTAAQLGRLCTAFGLTLSRLMVEAEGSAASYLPHATQPTWTDPETGFKRRAVAPPAAGFRVEIVEGVLPAGKAIAYDASPVAGLEHEVVVLAGKLDLTVEGTAHRLAAGDCLRFRLHGASRYACPGPGAARYLVIMAPG
jgi:transcriptional regulator with XRE-family HTH domain